MLLGGGTRSRNLIHQCVIYNWSGQGGGGVPGARGRLCYIGAENIDRAGPLHPRKLLNKCIKLLSVLTTKFPRILFQIYVLINLLSYIGP